MRKIIYVLSALLVLFLASCGAGPETAVPDAPSESLDSGSDSAAARPQLIEFYADW